MRRFKTVSDMMINGTVDARCGFLIRIDIARRAMQHHHHRNETPRVQSALGRLIGATNGFWLETADVPANEHLEDTEVIYVRPDKLQNL